MSGRTGLVVGSNVLVGSQVQQDDFDIFDNEKKNDSEKEVGSGTPIVNEGNVDSEKPVARENAVAEAPDDSPNARCKSATRDTHTRTHPHIPTRAVMFISLNAACMLPQRIF